MICDGIDMEDGIEEVCINKEWYSIAGSGGVGVYGNVSVGLRWWWWMLRMNWKAIVDIFWSWLGCGETMNRATSCLVKNASVNSFKIQN